MSKPKNMPQQLRSLLGRGAPNVAQRLRNSSMTRRAWLAGAAGCLSLPLLDSLRAKAAPTAAPKRFLIVYNPNGTVGEHFWPQQGGEHDFVLGKILQPFAAHRERLLITSGINAAVAQDPSNNGGPHQRGIGALFTGQTLLEGEFADGCGKTAGWANGQSIDQAIAEQIGLNTAFSSVEIGVRCNENDVQGRISYAAPGAPLPPINDPVELYNRLFFRNEPLDPQNPDSRAQGVLDTVKEQFNNLNKRIGYEDRQKLQKHLALVEDLERRIGVAGSGGDCVAPNAPQALDPDNEETMPEVSRMHLELLAHAFACDLTRVASIQYSTGFNRIRYPWVDELGEGHPLSHSGDSNTEARDALTARATWHASELAYFMDLLAAIPEGDGSVLDNTLILWGNEISRGNTHSLDNIPYLIFGNAGGALRTGRYVQFDGASSCDLLHTVAQAFDLELERFGHPDYATGVLSTLLA